MISVIIPCYNCEEFVGRAIESVLKQSHTDWDLILVNNNSTDNTQKILDEYYQKYPDKILCLKELKRGGAAARNKGLYASGREFIQFLDADDELKPDKLKRQLNLIIETKSDIVSAPFALIQNKNGKVIETTVHPEYNNVWKGLIGSKLGITSANLWRRNKIIEVNGWDNELSSSQEYDLLFRLLQNKAKIVFDDQVAAVIYSLDTSVSKSTDQKRTEKILSNLVTLRLRIKEYLIAENKYNNELNKFLNVFLYNHLMVRKVLAPKYVDYTINNLNLSVPLKLRVKHNLKYILKKLLKI